MMYRMLMIAVIGCGLLSCVSINNKVATQTAAQKKDSAAVVTAKDQYFVFSIAAVQFRYSIVTADTGSTFVLEKSDNGQWKPALSYAYSPRTGKVLLDVNNDGNPDLVNDWRWFHEVHLYNPLTQDFDGAVINLASEWTLLDSIKSIYCDYSESKNGPEFSRLYHFKNNEVEVLYSVKFITKAVEGEDLPIITALRFYRGDFQFAKAGSLISKTPVPEKDYRFDYVAYWTQQYKTYK